MSGQVHEDSCVRCRMSMPDSNEDQRRCGTCGMIEHWSSERHCWLVPEDTNYCLRCGRRLPEAGGSERICECGVVEHWNAGLGCWTLPSRYWIDA